MRARPGAILAVLVLGVAFHAALWVPLARWLSWPAVVLVGLGALTVKAVGWHRRR